MMRKTGNFDPVLFNFCMTDRSSVLADGYQYIFRFTGFCQTGNRCLKIYNFRQPDLPEFVDYDL